MQHERWQRIDEVFQSALLRDSNERSTFLEETCSGDLPLRLEVERLLSCYEQAASFLETPALQLVAGLGRTSPDYPSMEGEIILHYRVGARLGSGGMGVVYQGEDLKLRRGVALKFLYDDGESASGATNRLLAEARAASGLNHPNICTVYAIEEHRGQPVLVMELLEGETLRDRMKAERVNFEALIRLGLEACDALEAAHARGIVHRDIKPANIFISKDGRLKLLDFGVARWMRAPCAEEHPSKIEGTILYMSPEQLRGEEIDGRSDLFSLGVVLYELATGIRPFERSSARLTMDALLHDSPAAPSSLNPALPSNLDRVIGKMLEKDRDRRYGSAADVSTELQLLLSESQPRSARKLKIAGIVAGAALACGVGAILLERHQAPVLLTNQDTVVVGEFANKTGDPIFNDTLRQGLAVQLRQSPFLSLVSDERIQHVLQLMAKPAATPLTPEIAREICERTGSAAVLDGSISSLGKHYVLLLRAQRCLAEDLLFSEQVEAGAKEDVLRAISRMAQKFRRSAGESSTAIAKHSTPLSEATTPSLEAWKSFTEGMRVGMLQGHAVGMPFIKRAIEIDPHFATAQAMLGRDYSALGEMELAREHTRRAFRDRDRASDQERFFIDYSYDRLVTGNLEKAMETCEMWTHAYPRDTMGLGLCGAVAKVLGRFDKTMEREKAAIAVDPDSPYAYAHLISLALFRQNFPEARKWLGLASERKLGIPDFLMMRYLMAFLEENQAGMETAAAAAERWSETQDWALEERSGVLGSSGRLNEARAMSRRAVQLALQANRLEAAAQHEAAAAVREALFGNSAAARVRAAAVGKLSQGKDAQYGAALAFAIAGDLVRAQALMKDLEQRYPEDTIVRFNFLPTLRAISAMERGRAGKAIDILGASARYEMAWLGCCSVGFVGSLYPIYVRGEAYLALHRGPEAAAEFQKIIEYRGLVGSNPIGVLAYWRKGKGLAMAGNRQAAKKEYERFLSFWREADREMPAVRLVKAEYERL